jgi:hypothetical protein
VSGFELYRYTHSDGTAKDWAWCEHPGVGMEVRWGRAGRLVQKATYPTGKRRAMASRSIQIRLAMRPLTPSLRYEKKRSESE